MHEITTTMPSVAILWALRGLVHLKTIDQFVGTDGFSNHDLATQLGVDDFSPEIGSRDYDRSKIKQILRDKLAIAEKQLAHHQIPEALANNMARLREITGMTDLECRILEFAIMSDCCRPMDNFTGIASNITASDVPKHLAAYLAVPSKDVYRALSRKSALAKSGLLGIDNHDSGFLPDLRDYLKLPGYNFSEQMLSDECDFNSLFSDMVIYSKPSDLKMDDFSHIEDKARLLRLYLKAAIQSKKTGVNVLLYGKPGVGKTQFAKVVAQEMGVPLLEIGSENQDGYPYSGAQRFQAYSAAQAFFCRNDAIILFDEVEDVFSGNNVLSQLLNGNGQNGIKPGLHKAWVNSTLEENKIPTFWISNSVEGTLDPAYIRRFDLVIEVPIPTSVQRHEMVQKICGDAVSAQTIARLSASEELAPAVISRAIDVIKSIESEIDIEQASSFAEQMIDSTLCAQSYKRLGKVDAHKDLYEPAFVNTSFDLSKLADGVQASRKGRLLLMGPPGSGKTGYAHWLAQKIGSTILVKKGSDLMSPYVGQSEMNIAAAFAEAKALNAILLIDEVDSFLNKRTQANHNWEVALVNQVLVELSDFKGLFVATTNLDASGLDPAALRRFDLKIQFGYLRYEQSVQMMQKYMSLLGIKHETSEDYPALKYLHHLTPGDFAVVANQGMLVPIQSVEDFIASLEREHAAKGMTNKSIGFMRQ
jgi:SpoVK/Ycf46/Vps4 family AAA+-type ATPase